MRSATEPQPKRKPKTFETQRNRGSGGKKEETGKLELEKHKSNREEKLGGIKREQTSNHKGHEDHEGKAKKIFAAEKEFDE